MPEPTSDLREYPASGPESHGKDLREHVAILRRHKVQILVVASILGAIITLVALALPAVYRSTATILVQEQEVPPDLVRSTITSYADERIQVIGQQVMTRAVLLQLVDKYDLYERLRDRATSDQIVEFMRKDIKISTVDASISDRGSGRRVNTTIAFTISYDSPRPDHAQKVVNELVSLYLNENAKVRQQSAAETTAFLAQEADRLAAQIQDMEARLAEFKRRNVGRMPDSSGANLQLAERTDAELSRIEREISMLQDRRTALDSQLLLVSPNAATTSNPSGGAVSPEQRLRALQSQYASVSAIYSNDHPDVRRIQREIAKLKGDTGVAERGSADKLKDLEAQLAALKERYSEDHPDVQRLRRLIAGLKSPGSGDPAARSPDRHATAEPLWKSDNPAYVAAATQLENTKREIQQLSALRDDLRTKQRTYDSRLLQIPEVEREYRELTRDYDNAQSRYREVRAKQMQAEIAQELEKNRKAERFALGEPANFPERPHRPERLRIMLAGFALSLGGAVFLAWLRDAFDPSIKGPLELARIATVPLLTAIPYIETRDERTRKRHRAWIAGCLIGLLGMAFLVGVRNHLEPLSQVLDLLMHRIPI